ncbi:MAG TPA: hypothetical protein VFE46_08845 [Pirellulales bacterium]|jgi:hypothetical protein|nr:hypothetical protein [Pirellulales bacterium]
MKYLLMCVSSAALAMGGMLSTAAAQQPFSNTQSSPTVSPYLNLTTRQGGGGNVPGAYQTLVQPFIQQQQTNLQQQQQLQSLQKQQQTSLTGPERRGISSEIRGTGHVTTYMDYLHYYARPASGTPQAPRQ